VIGWKPLGIQEHGCQLRVKVLGLLSASSVVILSERTARRIGASTDSRLLLKSETGKSTYAGVIIATSDILAEDEVGIPALVADLLRVKSGDIVTVASLNVIQSVEYIKKKLRRERLARDEVAAIVRDVVSGLLDDAAISAFLSAQESVGMDDEELYYLTLEMAASGNTLTHPYPVYDEHSIGGVPGNSKVALVAVPTAVAFGLKVPKTSSRAIVSPSGTADTMEVLARVDLTPEEIRQALDQVGGTLAWTGRLNLSPADDIFVNVERRLRIDPESQMIASILSKKVAMGVSGLVIDIPTGEGAKVKSVHDAERLAARFLSVCHRLKIFSKALITFGSEPIGYTVGPVLEAREALETLMNRGGAPSLVHKALSIAAAMLEIAGLVKYGEGVQAAKAMLETGKPEKVFRKIIEFQGGNPDVKPQDLTPGERSYTFKAPYDGAVTKINNDAVTLIARAAGSPFDKKAGILFHAKIGYRVKAGDPLFTIYSTTSANLSKAVELANSLLTVEIGHMVLKSLP